MARSIRPNARLLYLACLAFFLSIICAAFPSTSTTLGYHILLALGASNKQSESDIPLHQQQQKPILVIGATGKLGSRIVQKLSRRNIPYRCLVRPSSQNFDRIQHLKGGRIFEGDLANYQEVRAAVCSDGGIGGCICASGSFRKRKLSDLFRLGTRNIKDTSHPYLVNHVGMENLCEAIKECNQIKGEGGDDDDVKIVKVTGVLLSLPRWHHISILGNLIYSGVLRWHKAGEKDIATSGINYTILRPGSFRDDDAECAHLKKGGMTVTEDGALPARLRVKKPSIGIDDLAELCIDCLESRDDIDGKVLYPRWLFNDNKA